jgi:hypothetical protein
MSGQIDGLCAKGDGGSWTLSALTEKFLIRGSFDVMSRRIIMVLLTASFASASATTPNPPHAIPPSTNLTLMCTGTRNAGGYPFGKQPASQERVRIVMNADPTLTRAATSTDVLIMATGSQQQSSAGNLPTICQPPKYRGDKCDARQDEDSLTVSSISSGTVRTLTLDKRTGAVHYGVGGMDGGWDFQGYCRPE